MLLPLALQPDAQSAALQTRLGTGPWMIPPFYLQQAAAASDLRLLGRQRDGERTVQILSFSGISPLAQPIDAPGATAERVTVLLAIDPSDGMLYSATELAGPPGGVQTSRITWRLIEEEFQQITSANNPFSITRAWNGIGEFPARPRPLPADLAVPAIPEANVIDPLRVLERSNDTFYAPATPPAGVDRALLLGSSVQTFNPRVDGLLYLGPQRRLLLRQIFASDPPAGEELQIESWQAALTPGRNQRYIARLERLPESQRHIRVLIEAYGFSRAELLAVIESLQPFDLAALAAQQELFARPEWSDVEARSLLLQALNTTRSVASDRVRYTRWRSYARHGPLEASNDPYRMPPFYGRPENDMLDVWQAGGANAVSFQQLGAADPMAFSMYRGVDRAWILFGAASTAISYRFELPSQAPILPEPYSYLIELLSIPGIELSRRGGDSGATTVVAVTSAEIGRYAYALNRPTNNGVYLADIRPETITFELTFAADGSLQALRVFGSDGPLLAEPVLIESYELEREQILPLAEAPPSFLNAQPPAVDLVIDLENPSISAPVFTIAEIARRTETPIFVLPSDRSSLSLVLAGSSAGVSVGSTLFQGAIDLQIGAYLRYRIDPAGSGGEDLQLLQGPAAPLRAYLRSSFDQAIWEQGEPLTTVIAGREVTAWIGKIDRRTRLVAEIDGTLIVAEGSSDWFEREAIPLLAELRPA
ncbi:MAG: hypothetical protein HC822_09440 [Oscillochloris sp.]|nr:hypothetical protein [Oscillochloris sp.]